MPTTIQVSEGLADELAERKGRGETYETVIWRLIDRADGADGTPDASAPTDREQIKCEHCGHVWTTASEAERPTCSNCTSKTDRLAP